MKTIFKIFLLPVLMVAGSACAFGGEFKIRFSTDWPSFTPGPGDFDIAMVQDVKDDGSYEHFTRIALNEYIDRYTSYDGNQHGFLFGSKSETTNEGVIDFYLDKVYNITSVEIEAWSDYDDVDFYVNDRPKRLDYDLQTYSIELSQPLDCISVRASHGLGLLMLTIKYDESAPRPAVPGLPTFKCGDTACTGSATIAAGMPLVCESAGAESLEISVNGGAPLAFSGSTAVLYPCADATYSVTGVNAEGRGETAELKVGVTDRESAGELLLTMTPRAVTIDGQAHCATDVEASYLPAADAAATAHILVCGGVEVARAEAPAADGQYHFSVKGAPAHLSGDWAVAAADGSVFTPAPAENVTAPVAFEAETCENTRFVYDSQSRSVTAYLGFSIPNSGAYTTPEISGAEGTLTPGANPGEYIYTVADCATDIDNPEEVGTRTITLTITPVTRVTWGYAAASRAMADSATPATTTVRGKTTELQYTLTKDDISGIADITADETGAAEYYTIDGMRTARPTIPGLYIRRTPAGQCSKVYVK